MTYGDFDTFPFNSCNTKELVNINIEAPFEGSCNNINEDGHFSHLCDKDIDTNLHSKTY